MKAWSAGLEVMVELNEDEAKRLKTEPLNGRFTFRGIGFEADMKRDIPFELSYSKEQEEPLEVSTMPRKVYFPDVNFVNFSIGESFYEGLDTYKSWAARFFGAGKLTIRTRKTL